MKRKVLYAGILILLLTLWGCSAKETPTPETVTAQAEAVTVPTEPEPTEPEKIKELVLEERYQIHIEENSTHYFCYVVVFPNSYFDWFEQNTYEVEGDRITFTIEGEQCIFRRTENSLILESGKLFARKGDDAVQVPVGTETTYKEEIKLRDGIYALDTSEYDFTFDEVLMDIDLTEMTFTLRCFDGNVVSGTLSFEEDKLVCSHENGKMRFRIDDTIKGNQGALSLHSTTVSYATGGSVASDELMICPQTDIRLQYTFTYVEDREEEIIADPDIVPLDSYKHLYQETFRFYMPAIGKDGQQDQHGYHFFIRHYPLAEKWEFQLYTKPQVRSIEVAAEERPDGSITFSLDGKQWNFHREDNDLRFDGGNLLIVGNWSDVKGQNYYEMELPEGTLLNNTDNNYVYDALYILPGKTLDECYAAIQLDTKNQWVKIQCWDGKVLRGPFTYGDEYCNYIVFECIIPDFVGTRTTQINLRPSGHALGVSNGWMLNIGPGEMNSYDDFYFFPVQGVTPQETIEE